MPEIGYASPKQILRDALPILLPRNVENVADYALKHRRLSNTGGGYVGPWRHDLTPYLIEPMQRLTSIHHMTIALVGPGQVAKTVVAENWWLHTVGADPADMLWYMQTDEAVEAYVKGRINPMIDQHRLLRDNQGLRTVDDSLHFKRFKGMKIEFLSAQMNNLINKSAPRIIGDEIDAYADFGDPMAQFNVRRQTYGKRSKVLVMSHCDKARGMKPERDWTAGIMAIYGDSDRCIWYWPCPHCGKWSSPCPLGVRVMSLEYVREVDAVVADTPVKRPPTLDEIEASAFLLCPINGCVVSDSHRRAMNTRGKWVGLGEDITEDGEVTGERVKRRTAGYWIVGAMSPFIIGGIGGLARAREKAEREFEIDGDETTIKEVIVKQWGFPYTPPRSHGSVDANDLADRADPHLKLGRVPEGVRFLTLAVDVQVAHFEWLVRGWGVGAESWIIDRGRIPADTATSKEDWDGLLKLFSRSWPLATDPSRGMKPRACVYDSGGAMGVTQQAYLAWSRWRKLRITRLFGKISGRDCWSILPTKGTSGANATKLSVVYPDTIRTANKAAGGGAVPVAMFNANLFKDDLAGQLMKGMPGPLYVNFPYALRSAEVPHVWFEQATAERPNKKGQWERTSPGQRNEALDLLVMTHVAAHLHGVARIDWTRPPGWAAEWERNSLIVAAVPSASAMPAAVAPPIAFPSSPATQAARAAPPTSTPKSMEEFIDKFPK
jgi:phage terminase large subunit GpA-like protein